MEEQIEQEDSKKPEAKFNFALASLERIHKLLQDITNIEKRAGDSLSVGGAQASKRKLVRQLLCQAYVLLDDSNKEEIKKKVYGLKPVVYVDYQGLMFSSKLDSDMNDCIILIQESMQKNGKFFVLPKEETGLF